MTLNPFEERVLVLFFGTAYEFPWLHTVLGFLLATMLVRYSIVAAHRYELFARPSERASHTFPTPRIGGMGMGVAFYLVAFIMYFRPYAPVTPSPWNAAVIVGGAWALIGGFLDDVLELNPRWKFLFQFAAAGSAVALGFSIESITLPNQTLLPLPHELGPLFSLLFIVFIMNAYNFMDGMDGQASLFGTIVALGICLPLVIQNFISAIFAETAAHSSEAQMLATLAGTLLGLLVYNYPGKAQSDKTFMGDSGSQFVGFLLAVFAMRMEQTQASGFSLIAALILLSPFLWDVCYTLVRRLARRENILQAHRSHLYQRLMIAGWSHGRTLGFNCVLWLICFWLAQLYAQASRTSTPATLHWIVIAMTLGVLVLYTLTVLAVEKRSQSD